MAQFIKLAGKNSFIRANLGRNRSKLACLFFSHRCLINQSSQQIHPLITRNLIQLRKFSGESSSGEEKDKSGGGKKKKHKKEESAGAEEDEGEDVQISWPQAALVFTVLGLMGYFIYEIGKEMWPSRMRPNWLFNEALAEVKSNTEIISRYGEPLKGYGRDHGGTREGRRNFPDHVEFTDKEDQKKHNRIRFTIEGSMGKGYVYAEVADGMQHGEYVYLMVQDLRDGSVTMMSDNRSLLSSLALAKDDEERDAIRRALGSSK